MTLPILLLLYCGVGIVSRVASKTCSNIVAARTSIVKYLSYLVITGIIACGVFFVLGGFKLSFNTPTLLFSLAFALVCIASVVATISIYRFSSVAGAVVLASFGGNLASMAVGALIFGETITPSSLLRIGLLFIGCIFTFIETKKGEKRDEKRGARDTLILLLLLLLLVAAGCGNTVTMKLYGITPGVSDNNSFFFLTNVVIIVFSIIPLIALLLKRGAAAGEIRPLFRPIALVAMTANTATSNVMSLLSISIFALMDVSVFQPMSSAFAIIAGLVASLIFREKLGLFSYLAAATAVLAVII